MWDRPPLAFLSYFQISVFPPSFVRLPPLSAVKKSLLPLRIERLRNSTRPRHRTESRKCRIGRERSQLQRTQLPVGGLRIYIARFCPGLSLREGDVPSKEEKNRGRQAESTKRGSQGTQTPISPIGRRRGKAAFLPQIPQKGFLGSWEEENRGRPTSLAIAQRGEYQSWGPRDRRTASACNKQGISNALLPSFQFFALSVMGDGGAQKSESSDDDPLPSFSRCGGTSFRYF